MVTSFLSCCFAFSINKTMKKTRKVVRFYNTKIPLLGRSPLLLVCVSSRFDNNNFPYLYLIKLIKLRYSSNHLVDAMKFYCFHMHLIVLYIFKMFSNGCQCYTFLEERAKAQTKAKR